MAGAYPRGKSSSVQVASPSTVTLVMPPSSPTGSTPVYAHRSPVISRCANLPSLGTFYAGLPGNGAGGSTPNFTIIIIIAAIRLIIIMMMHASN